MFETVFFVYRLTFSNGKVYIGMSKTCPKKGYTRRYAQHGSAAVKGKTGLIYDSQREMSKATGHAESTISGWLKVGKVVKL